jgi:hypothetical protein
MQGHPERQLTVRRAVMALTASVLLAGCQVPASSSARPGPATTAAAAAAAVGWADRLCGVILEYDSVPAKFEVDSTSPDAAVSSLTKSLDALSARINDALGKLREVGESPVAGGDEAVQSLASLLETRRSIVDGALTRLRNLNLSDRTAATAALQGVASDLQSLKTPVNPLEGMGSRFPELQAAARSADTCTEITRLRASRSALPPAPSYPSYPDEFPTSPSTPPPGSGSSTTSSSPPPEPTYPTL